MQPLDNIGAREAARKLASEGVAILAMSINACAVKGRPYQYSQASIIRFTKAIEEIVSIVEGGEIHLTPIEMARTDSDFQDFKNNLLAMRGE